MRNRRRAAARALSISGVVRHVVAAILALDRANDIRAAAEPLPVSTGPDRRDVPFVGSAGDQQQGELVFEDLQGGFHDDVDSITLAIGSHHTCALEYRPGVDFGGPVRCWGRNDWGQSTPSDDIFVQVLDYHVPSLGVEMCTVVALVYPEASALHKQDTYVNT